MPPVPSTNTTNWYTEETEGRPPPRQLFLDGKIDRKAINFLIDTGCTTNLSKSFYDRFPLGIQQTMRAKDSSHGVTADGSLLQFYGKLTLDCRVGELAWRERFIVAKIKDDAILSMPFLIQEQRRLSFVTAEPEVDEKRIPCVDKTGDIHEYRVIMAYPTRLTA